MFQYREAGGSWPGTTRTVTVPFIELTGLTNGQAYEFRVMAVNAIGDSPWSLTGTGTPTASAPSGGSTLALRATAGDGEVVVDWIEPDAGGSPITEYRVQWAGPGQSFTASRQRTVMGATTDTVPNLTNGTAYRFQVIAVNGVGASTPSNEASVSPRGDIFPEGGFYEHDDTITLQNLMAGEINGRSSWTLGPGTYLVGWNVPNESTGAPTGVGLFEVNGSSSDAVGVDFYPTAGETASTGFGVSGDQRNAMQVATVRVAPGATATITISRTARNSTPESATLFAVRMYDSA